MPLARLHNSQRLAPDYVSAETLLGLSGDLRLVRIVAHPLRPRREIDRLGRHLLARFDGLEVNAKDLAMIGASAKAHLRNLAGGSGMYIVAGSDAHHPLQLGTVWNESPDALGAAPQREWLSTVEVHHGPIFEIEQLVMAASEAKSRILREHGIVRTGS